MEGKEGWSLNKRVKGTSDAISEVCIGINKRVRNYVGLPHIDELRYGCADIAIGHNAPFGQSRTKPPVHCSLALFPRGNRAPRGGGENSHKRRPISVKTERLISSA